MSIFHQWSMSYLMAEVYLFIQLFSVEKSLIAKLSEH